MIRWDEVQTPLDNTVSYNVYRSNYSNFSSTNLIGVATTNLFFDNGSLPGTNYYYKVKTSFSATWSSAFSNQDLGNWIDGFGPSSTFIATQGTYTDSIVISDCCLTYGSSPYGTYQADYVVLYRNDTNDVNSAQLITPFPTIFSSNIIPWDPHTSFTDTTAVAGVDYYYWMRNVYDDGIWYNPFTQQWYPQY